MLARGLHKTVNMRSYLWCCFALVISLFFLSTLSVQAIDCQALLDRIEKRKALTSNPEEIRRLERVEARIAARPERAWMKGKGGYETTAEIERALQEGRLLSAETINDLPGLRVSANMSIRATTEFLNKHLEQIGIHFQNELKMAGLESDHYFLLVTSAIRSAEFQRFLNEKAEFPSAAKSSHVYGLAIDISYAFFEDNQPQIAAIQEKVLREYAKKVGANLIREPGPRVWHIAFPAESQSFLAQ